MTPEERTEVRKLRGELCSLAVVYKGVKPEMCADCESPCEPGRKMLKALGIEPVYRPCISDVFESVHHARGRRAQKVVKDMNRRS